jgi:hypothetical protein
MLEPKCSSDTHKTHVKKLHAESYIHGCRLYTDSPLTNTTVLEEEMSSHEYCQVLRHSKVQLPHSCFIFVSASSIIIGWSFKKTQKYPTLDLVLMNLERNVL